MLLAGQEGRWQDSLLLAGQFSVGRTGCCLKDRPLLPGQIFIGRTGCCLRDRLSLTGQIVFAKQVVVSRTSSCWQDR